MPRGNWNIIFAAIGIALAAALLFQSYQFYQAAEQQHSEYQYQPARSPGFRIGVRSQRPTPAYKPSCNNPYQNEDSDLCAQWAAVDQVTEANRLTSLNLRLAVLTFVATAIGTVFLFITLRETWSVSRRELRAYLFVDGVAVGDGTHLPQRDPALLGIAGCVVGIKNSGSTPAHRVRHWCGIEFAYPEKEHELRAPIRLEDAFPTTVPPAGSITADRLTTRKPGAKMVAAIRKGRAALFVFGAVEYLDVFDRPQRTNYRLYYTGSWPPPLNPTLRFSATGNDAT